MDNQQKPDWVTSRQWEMVPSVAWWENQRQTKVYLEQSPPVTPEEAQMQQKRGYELAGISLSSLRD